MHVACDWGEVRNLPHVIFFQEVSLLDRIHGEQEELTLLDVTERGDPTDFRFSRCTFFAVPLKKPAASC